MSVRKKHFIRISLMVFVVVLAIVLPLEYRHYSGLNSPRTQHVANSVTNVFPHEDRHFIDKIYLAVRVANDMIRAKREHLKQLYRQWQAGQKLNTQALTWLRGLAQKYALVEVNFKHQKTWQNLFNRVAVVPASLAIAQAIEESDWGRSRFAREAHNLYGVWCYTAGCGLVPKDRPKGAFYEVRRYSNIQASVADYIHILNTRPYYAHLRAIRTRLQQNGKTITGIRLATGLSDYSTERYQYVLHLQELIRRYQLVRFDA